MQGRGTFGFLLLCSLASSVSSARIHMHYHSLADTPEDKLRDNHCETKAIDWMEGNGEKSPNDRFMAYISDGSDGSDGCRVVEEDHVVMEEGKFVVNDEGKELICSCKHEDLKHDAPDSSALVAECGDDPDNWSGPVYDFMLFDALDAIRKSCPSDDNEAPLMEFDEENEDARVDVPEEKPITTTTTTMIVDAPEENQVVAEVLEEEPTTTTTTTTVVVDVPEEEEIVVPQSPVAPIKGSMVKQMKFEYGLKNVLAVRSEPDCERLKDAFLQCDYKRNNKVYLKQIDNMLDKIDDDKKAELIETLKTVYAKVGKDPDADPMTFKDWTLYKLDVRKAKSCLLKHRKIFGMSS